MDLELIVKRFVKGLQYIDENYNGPLDNVNFLPGLQPMYEHTTVKEILNWWIETYPNDFNPRNAYTNEYRYPNIQGARCDIVFSNNGKWLPAKPEWAIEVKRIQLVGNNGNNNDYGLPKILSPYLKDRSLIHDIKRMQISNIAKKKVVLGYGFEYDFNSCRKARDLYPDRSNFIDNLENVCQRNDPHKGQLYLDPLIETVEILLKSRKLVKGKCIIKKFNAWQHPCGGIGKVFAWEISNPKK